MLKLILLKAAPSIIQVVLTKSEYGQMATLILKMKNLSLYQYIKLLVAI